MIIEVQGLCQRYGRVEALRGVSFSVRPGEVLAILGPNGAGKTTLCDILQGYLRPTQGTVMVLGVPPARFNAAVYERIGVMAQSSALYDELSVRETLRLFAGYYTRPRPLLEVLELVGLSGKEARRVSALSGGEKRRLEFALAVVGDPELLFLDEPTTGLDVEARRSFWNVVLAFAAAGKTIVLTTHYLEEAQQLADRVLVLSSGRIVAEGPPEALGAPLTIIRFKLPKGYRLVDLPEALQSLAEAAGAAVTLKVERADAALAALTAWAQARQVGLEQLEVAQPSLEAAYLELLAADREVA